MSCFKPISPASVRAFIWDRKASDNQIDMDLTFSDEEIREAMMSAAREYNSIKPYVGTADPTRLDGSTNIFLDGTVAYLYIARMSNMQRNDLEYTAGGVTVTMEQRQIAYMKDMIPFHMDRFKKAATDRKLAHNISQGFAAL